MKYHKFSLLIRLVHMSFLIPVVELDLIQLVVQLIIVNSVMNTKKKRKFNDIIKTHTTLFSKLLCGYI